MNDLQAKYFERTAKYVSKGKGRTQLQVKTALKEGLTYMDYLCELKATDSRLYGIELCAIEKEEYLQENYMYFSKSEYRRRITAYAIKYGLLKDDIKRFYAV
jgi:hypothetical protein